MNDFRIYHSAGMIISDPVPVIYQNQGKYTSNTFPQPPVPLSNMAQNRPGCCLWSVSSITGSSLLANADLVQLNLWQEGYFKSPGLA